MEQLVRVKETYDDGTALVFRIRESACSGDCHKCSGCGAAKEAVLLKADNPIGADRGDLVKVESATAPVLKAAVVLYVLPLVLFFLGYFGSIMVSSMAVRYTAAAAGFVLGIVIAILYDRRLRRDGGLKFTIIRLF